MTFRTTETRKVLVCGASIAGPAIGYWLHAYGFDVTLVERAEAVRDGGYPIDVRGTAIDVMERMGVLPDLQAAHIRTRKVTFVGANARTVGSIKPEALMGGVEGRDVELPRGRLTALLFDRTRDRIQYRFGDWVEALTDQADGVDVEFHSGRRERFDLVLVAEGLHSTTRALVFGPEQQFSRYLGYCFAGLSLPQRDGLQREALIYNTPGKVAAVYAVAGEPRLFALLALKRPQPTPLEMADRDEQRRSMARAFAGAGWFVPELIAAAGSAEDFYFDSMTQIHMPTWSSGRVALLGDAAYGPSFFSGQGTSIALVGAYVLAGELATHDDHAAAFRAYERTARAFIEANQATAKDGCDTMAPDSAAKLWLRNGMIRLAPLLTRLGLVSRHSRKVHSSLELPIYQPGT